MTFTVGKADLERAVNALEGGEAAVKCRKLLSETGVAKVSVVGIGMRSHSGVASTVFNTLARENINISMISTSEIRISCVVEEKYTELAVRVLHTAFGLDREDE